MKTNTQNEEVMLNTLFKCKAKKISKMRLEEIHLLWILIVPIFSESTPAPAAAPAPAPTPAPAPAPAPAPTPAAAPAPGAAPANPDQAGPEG